MKKVSIFFFKKYKPQETEIHSEKELIKSKEVGLIKYGAEALISVAGFLKGPILFFFTL